MTLQELLPSIQTLTQSDKEQLFHMLAFELNRGKAGQLPDTYPIWSPFDAYEAAEALAAVLDEDRT